eukprot:3111727-Prymnesium_polylepis.3
MEEGMQTGQFTLPRCMRVCVFRRAPQRRNELFNAFDTTGNGILSLFEIKEGFATVLGEKGRIVANALAPAITRAFHAARDAESRGKAAEQVTRGEEFRLLLVYLKRYFELLKAFDEIDTSDDRRVTKKEFLEAIPLLKTWGVRMDHENPEKEFDRINTDGGSAL